MTRLQRSLLTAARAADRLPDWVLRLERSVEDGKLYTGPIVRLNKGTPLVAQREND